LENQNNTVSTWYDVRANCQFKASRATAATSATAASSSTPTVHSDGPVEVISNGEPAEEAIISSDDDVPPQEPAAPPAEVQSWLVLASVFERP
jgi:hypothetical protein